MNQETDVPTWWELHLRQARGEHLSEAERQRYDAEVARQDQSSLPNPIETLKAMRATLAAVALENAQLRLRIEHLEREIAIAEQALSRPTRELLGVRE